MKNIICTVLYSTHKGSEEVVYSGRKTDLKVVGVSTLVDPIGNSGTRF